MRIKEVFGTTHEKKTKCFARVEPTKVSSNCFKVNGLVDLYHSATDVFYMREENPDYKVFLQLRVAT